MALPLTYNWKNLFVRKTTTVLTCLIIAAVVGVLTWLVGFKGALDRSLSFANDQAKIIVLRQGATSETNSAISPEDANKLAQLQSVAVDAAGEPLMSREMVVQVSLPRKRDKGATFANVAVRGVTDTAFAVHPNVRLLGSRIGQGQLEVVVGVQAAKQFGGVEVGDTINLGYGGNRGFKVVGHFSANGAPIESEIWGPLTILMNGYNRTAYSSVTLRLREGTDPKPVVAEIKSPAIDLSGQTESEYWTEQTTNVRAFMAIVGVLVGIMAIAATFAIANTMYASVAGRTREIAMLRTIGFSPGQVLLGFLYEAVFLSLIGGALGLIACAIWLSLVGNTKDMFGQNTFTTMGFEIKLGPVIILEALGAVTAVGLLGALFPAWRASKLEVIQAMRGA